jgi:hypothetical protein
MEGLSLSTLKQDEHGGLCGSGHWSIIPYVHGHDCCIAVCGAVLALSMSKWFTTLPPELLQEQPVEVR